MLRNVEQKSAEFVRDELMVMAPGESAKSVRGDDAKRRVQQFEERTALERELDGVAILGYN